MNRKWSLVFGGILFVFIGFKSYNDYPRVWEEERLEDLLIPNPMGLPFELLPEGQYYSLPERVIYKTYPFYFPGKEPEGYLDSLRLLSPRVIYSKDDVGDNDLLLEIGQAVFDMPTLYMDADSRQASSLLEILKDMKVPQTHDGKVPFFSWVIREEGTLELGTVSCTTCHMKLMPDKSILRGAQGNFPFDDLTAMQFEAGLLNPDVPEEQRMGMRKGLENSIWGTPYHENAAQSEMLDASDSAFVKSLGNTFGGVVQRTGTTIGYPVSIPDLFDLGKRKYLDHSGKVINSGIESIMLYATLATETERFEKINGHSIYPWPKENMKMLQDRDIRRYADWQLYALSRYLYQLTPPENPNSISPANAERAQGLFAKEGCVTCHPPPLYTINKLTPADGFNIPEEHLEKYDIFPVSVGTNSFLTRFSRRGTGYYKIPSLRGVWNRQALLHDGSLTSLEELLDSTRLNENYVPSGYMPGWKKYHPVMGHPFGFDLTQEEKSILIQFLKTL